VGGYIGQTALKVKEVIDSVCKASCSSTSLRPGARSAGKRRADFGREVVEIPHHEMSDGQPAIPV